jgi:hypothetical protein
MTTKFRRNTDRALLNHLNDYNDVRKDVDIVQDNTTNTGIITVINPLSDDLDMNNQNIMNCADIETKTINGTGYVRNPANADLSMAGNGIFACSYLSAPQLIAEGNLLIRAQDQLTLTSVNEQVVFGCTADFGNNDVYSINTISSENTLTNNIQSNTGTIIINSDIRPDATDLRTIGSATYAYDRMTANAFDTTAINAIPGYTQIIINNDLSLDTNNKIKNIFTTETKNLDALIPGGTINVLSNLDLKTTKNIIGVNNIDAKTFNGGSILTNPLTVDLNLAGFSIYNAGAVSTGSIYTETIDVSDKIELALNGSIINGVLVQTAELQADTLKSVSPSTADISVMNNINMQQKNISDVQQLTVKQIRKSTVGAQFNDIMVYDGINMNNQKIINCNDLKMTGVINTAGNSIILNGGQLNNVGGANIVGDGKITGVGDIATTTINGYNPMYNPSIADLNMNLNSITNTNNLQVHSFSKTTTIPGANILFNSPIDMNLNNLLNVSQMTTRQINNVVYVRSSADLTSVIPAGIYVICGQVVLTQPYNIGGDVSFFGLGATTSELLFNSTTPAGTCINTIDNNVNFSNLKITNTSIALRLFNGANSGKNKRLSFNNCLITDCKNEMFNIVGYNLIGFSHTNFIYNYPTALHLYINGCRKLIIDGCNFTDSYKLADPPPLPPVFGLANLIDLYGSCQSVVITNSIISPTETQNGIFIDNAQTSLHTLISNNTFIDGGITTGQYVAYTLTSHPELSILGNNISNLKAILEGSVINNTTFTATLVNQYVAVNWGAGFTVPTNIRFATTAVPFEFKYIGNKPISCLVSCSVGGSTDAKGNETVLFGIFKNNAIGRIIQTDIEQNIIKSFSYSTILNLVKNDLLQFRVQNTTTGTDATGFLGESLNASLIEI